MTHTGIADQCWGQLARGTSESLDNLFLDGERIFEHKLARFNYTTYDVRRAQDTVRVGGARRDIMLLAERHDDSEDLKPRFLYARVIGIFHANVIYAGADLQVKRRSIAFLWVRWFEDVVLPQPPSRPPQVRFPPMSGEASFGFVDPSAVLRGCHIVPAFAAKRLHTDSISHSPCAGDADDWTRYYVGM